jgi:predicted ATPase
LNRLVEDSMVWDEEHSQNAERVMWQFDPEVAAKDLKKAIRKSDVEKLNDLVLVDRRANTVVSHRDVGIGISQVLPVLVAAYASSQKTLAMEQPEIHLHPKLQAELGDVFISSAVGPQKNLFILETHSEHLILRIMRRMRETANGELPEHCPPVRAEDVSILYVEPKGSSSIVRVLELDPQGDLLDPWPGGFFEEGFRERFS